MPLSPSILSIELTPSLPFSLSLFLLIPCTHEMEISLPPSAGHGGRGRCNKICWSNIHPPPLLDPYSEELNPFFSAIPPSDHSISSLWYWCGRRKKRQELRFAQSTEETASLSVIGKTKINFPLRCPFSQN
jgi:hypothetical protein